MKLQDMIQVPIVGLMPNVWSWRSIVYSLEVRTMYFFLVSSTLWHRHRASNRRNCYCFRPLQGWVWQRSGLCVYVRVGT